MAADLQTRIAGIIARYESVPGGLLPLLHAIQSELGYVPPASVGDIARALHLSRAEVHGVISFYHDFRSGPGGRHRVQVCAAEACQSMGGRSIEARASELLGIEFGETTMDGSVSLDRVYCLGNCACAPSLRIDDAIYARVDEAQLEQLLSGLRATRVTP